jgi:AbrB family looped-hinge helix DNA binding protein
MGDLVRIKEKFQVTIPAALRRQLALSQGDYLEVSLSELGIVLRPQRMVEALSRPSLIDFMAETRVQTRTRTEIDAALSADRASWDK